MCVHVAGFPRYSTLFKLCIRPRFQHMLQSENINIQVINGKGHVINHHHKLHTTGTCFSPIFVVIEI